MWVILAPPVSLRLAELRCSTFWCDRGLILYSSFPKWPCANLIAACYNIIFVWILICVILSLQVTRAVVLAVAAAALTAAQQSLFLLEQRLLWSELTEVMNAQQPQPRASHFPADPPYCWWWPPYHSHSGQCRLNGDNTWVWPDCWLLYCYIFNSKYTCLTASSTAVPSLEL